MTDIEKNVKNASQDLEAKINTEEDHAEGKPSSETLNKAKVKVSHFKIFGLGVLRNESQNDSISY
jgi:hypothetical protein